MNGLFDLLDEAVRSVPDRLALHGPGRRLSYAGLDSVVAGAAAGLSAQGVGHGDVVALWSDNRIEGAVALLALSRLGARVAPLNPTMTAGETDALLARLAPDAVAVADGAEPAFPVTTGIRRVHAALDRAGRTAAEPPSPDETALILFTAGSTGVPKPIPLSHRNLAASITHIRDTYRLTSGDATLLAMPLSHGHGLIAGLLATLASGGTATFPATGRFSAHTFAGELTDAGATWYTASPTMHRIILLHAGDGHPRLRFVRSCSEALPGDVAARLTDVFRAPVVPAYGMTETSHQACSNPLPPDGPLDLATVGPATGVSLSVRREDGSAAGVGEQGEVWIRGTTVAAVVADPDGWFHTGDLGSVDAGGYLTLSGRLKDIIDHGGEKISPEEVEQALATDPAVAAAVAYGKPDPLYGESVAAAVVARPGHAVDVDALLAAVRQVLPRAAVPGEIRVLPELPLTLKGTVDRRAVAAMP